MKVTNHPLVPGMFYHIYNRGNNREDLFIEPRNYTYFLHLYAKHIEPVADTHAYCLLKNHFHVLLRIKLEEEYRQTSQVFKTCEVSEKRAEREKPFNPSQAFANLFNAYAKAINKAYGRTGSLFEERFGRIPVTNIRYRKLLLYYIHHNPQRHGFVTDFRNYPWSSYFALIDTRPTRLQRAAVLGLFGTVRRFEEFHRYPVADEQFTDLIDDDFECATA